MSLVRESKIENELYKKLAGSFPELKKQLHLEQFYYDYYMGDKIIEFNGDYWHGNPNIYEAFDVIELNGGIYAHQLWEKDIRKKEIAEKYGYKMLTVWESEYTEKPIKTFMKCYRFLSGK